MAYTCHVSHWSLGVYVLKLAGPDKSVGIIAASAEMDPSDPQWNDNPDIKAFRYLLQNFYPEGDQNNALAFLDYSIADVFFQVVRRCGDRLSREHLVGSYTYVEGLHFPALLPRITLRTSATNYDSIEQLQLFRFNGEHLVPFNELVHSE